MRFKELRDKIKIALDEQKIRSEALREKRAVDAQQAREAEEARVQAIVDGNIEPIETDINLPSDESAYLYLEASRIADVEYIIDETTGKTKRKGVIVRAIVGGVLLGVPGAAVGALTSKKKHSSSASQKTMVNQEIIDSGVLLLTNKRVVFIGKEIISIPYSEIMSYEAGKSIHGQFSFVPKYQDMLANEAYVVSGPGADDLDLFYCGVQNLS